MQQLQARVHHTQPLVVAGQVLALFAYDLAQPLLDFGVVDIIVVDPALVAGVVRRIDVDTLHLALITRQQRFQRLQVIAVDHHIFAAVILGVLSLLIKAVLTLQHAIRYILMVVDDLIFSNPI